MKTRQRVSRTAQSRATWRCTMTCPLPPKTARRPRRTHSPGAITLAIVVPLPHASCKEAYAGVARTQPGAATLGAYAKQRTNTHTYTYKQTYKRKHALVRTHTRTHAHADLHTDRPICQNGQVNFYEQKRSAVSNTSRLLEVVVCLG